MNGMNLQETGDGTPMGGLLNGEKVNARTLHGNLGVKERFNDWWSRYSADFAEGVEWRGGFTEKTVKPLNGTENADLGGRPQKNYLLTIDMAKHLAMMAKTEAGKRVRQYLIKVEEAWNTPEMAMIRGLQAAEVLRVRLEAQNADLRLQVAELEPKAEFYDQVAGSKDAIQMRDVAAILNIPGMGRNDLFGFLREHKVLDGRNIPYRKYQDRGYFRVIEQMWTDRHGETRISFKTLVYQSGIDWIRKKIKDTTSMPETAGEQMSLVFNNADTIGGFLR